LDGQFRFKRDPVDHFGFVEKKRGLGKYFAQERVAVKYSLLNLLHLSVLSQVVAARQVADVTFAILNSADPAVAGAKLVQRSLVARVIEQYVILHANVWGPATDEATLQLVIELRSLAMCANNHAGNELSSPADNCKPVVRKGNFFRFGVHHVNAFG